MDLYLSLYLYQEREHRFFPSDKDMEIRGYLSNGEGLNNLWYKNIKQYHCAIRNYEKDSFRENQKYLF